MSKGQRKSKQSTTGRLPAEKLGAPSSTSVGASVQKQEFGSTTTQTSIGKTSDVFDKGSATTEPKDQDKGGFLHRVGETVKDVARSAGEKLQEGVEIVKTMGHKENKEENKSGEGIGLKASILGDYNISKPEGNRGAVYNGSGKIVIKSIPYPEMVLPWNKEPHTAGAILRVMTSGICGSDLHAFRGRTAMAPGTVLGHEFLGEIVEVGPGVNTMKTGDWGVVPFNVSCGTCDSCKELRPETCDKTNNQKHNFGQGGVYGYVCGGDWQGGQADYVFVPWIDYNFLKFSNKPAASRHLLDLTLLSDVLPTAYHGTEEARVEFGKSVYIAGAGPIGLTAAVICNLKGASRVFISDFSKDRLKLAEQFGCITLDLNEIKDEKKLSERIKEKNGSQWCDSGIECVGYEARGFASKSNVCAAALQGCVEVVKPGGFIGVLGAFFAGDPKAPSVNEKQGVYSLPLGVSWMKGQSITGGQASCIRYMRRLEQMVMADKLPISKILNVNVISLEDVPSAYDKFSKTIPHKYIIDVANVIGKRGPLVESLAPIELPVTKAQACSTCNNDTCSCDNNDSLKSKSLSSESGDINPLGTGSSGASFSSPASAPLSSSTVSPPGSSI